ncbi:mitochondrial import inner membrane translocase subunit TIM13 [Xylariales sp. AK1849]|nr:mitochondrial import inner membrane translocase subunit TIM13 [Xylariales sp. AK1849]
MDSENVKAEVIKQVRTQYAMNNARELIEKINEHCFQKCVPNPSSSLSSGETMCFTQCMEKYMSAWNQVSTTYISRIQREG